MASIVAFPKTAEEFTENFRLRVSDFHKGTLNAEHLVYLTDQDLGILDNNGEW